MLARGAASGLVQLCVESKERSVWWMQMGGKEEQVPL